MIKYIIGRNQIYHTSFEREDIIGVIVPVIYRNRLFDNFKVIHCAKDLNLMFWTIVLHQSKGLQD